jgi:hypothetical protein
LGIRSTKTKLQSLQTTCCSFTWLEMASIQTNKSHL